MDYNKISKQHEQELMDKKNVNMVYIGYKIKNGKKTNVISCVIGVSKKVPLENLNEDDKIPSEIDGTQTDVVEIGEIKALGTCVINPGDKCDPHGNQYNPVIGGISIGMRKIDDSSTVQITSSGTLGAICIDKDDNDIVVLTNNHVIGNTHKIGYNPMVETISTYTFTSYSESTAIDVPIYQPSYADNGNVFNPMMKVKKIEGFRSENDSSDPQYIDAAVLKMDNISTTDCGALKLSNENGTPFRLTDNGNHEHTGLFIVQQSVDLINNDISNIIITSTVDSGHSHDITIIYNNGQFESTNISGNHGHSYQIFGNSEIGPYRWAFSDEIKLDDLPFKSGRTTGMVNFGEIISLNTSTYVDMGGGNPIYFANQMMIYHDLELSYSGDSGSGVYMIINGHTKLIGILFAGGTLNDGYVYLVNPIWRVADTLNLKAWNGDIVLENNVGASITKNNKLYNYVGPTMNVPTHD